MRTTLITFLVTLTSAFAPALAFAQNLDRLNGAAQDTFKLVNILIPIVMGVAVIFFIWGLVSFIRASGEGGPAVETGKRRLLWGIIALFVMTSIWGIVAYLQSTLGVEGGGTMSAPTVSAPDNQAYTAPGM